jgi:capsular polysaccharide biosynthesis protein
LTSRSAPVLRPEAWLAAAEAICLPFLSDAEAGELAMGFAPYVAHLADVRLLPDDWLLLGDHGLLIESLDPMMPLNPTKATCISAYNGGVATLELPEDEVVLDEPCVLLGNHASHYHWLVYHLPRLMALERIADLQSLRIVVSDRILPRQLESLALAGISESRLLRVKPGNVYRCASIWVPSALTYRLQVHPAALRWLRRTYIGSESPRARGRRLFASRSDAPIRHLVNEEELVRELAPLGFELIRGSELRFAEQVKLFSEAEAVVGGTGAALSNVVFMPAGSLMMELHNYHAAQFFDALCERLGQRYERLIGELRPNAPGIRVHDCDFYVPPASLRARLRELLGTP